MAFRHRGALSRPGSSGSSSSSASASPSRVPPLNFTLYGAPAPRSAHRTSSGTAKANPRRRSTRPTAPPPASPLSTCCTDDFRLDLSSLAADEFEPIVISRPNGSEICCIDDENVINESGNQYSGAGICIHAERTDDNVGTNTNDVNQNSLSEEFDNIHHTGKGKEWLGYKDSEGKLSENHDTGSSSSGSQCSDTGRTSSDLISSSQAFSDERSSNARSCLLDSSSYLTLSEYSADSCSSKCLCNSSESCGSEISISSGSQASKESKCDLTSGIRHNNEIPEGRIAVIPVASPRKRIPAVKQLIRRFPNENLSLKPQNTRHKESSIQSSSGVISNGSTNTESSVRVPPRHKDNMCVCVSKFVSLSTESRSEEPDSLDISSTLRNGYDLYTNATEPSTSESSEANVNKSEFIENQYISNNQASDNQENNIINVSPVVCGHCCLNNSHETLIKEWTVKEETVTDQVHVCCARSIEICNCLLNCSISDESHNRAVPNSETCNASASCSRNESSFDEKPDEIAIAMEMSSQNKASAAEEAESVSSGLNSRATSETSISLTNLENNADFDGTFDNSDFTYYQQLSPADNKGFGRKVYSEPTGPHVPNRVRSSSVLKCDCESGGRTRFLLERLESGYFPDVPVSDIPLSAGEFTEAILHARQLVRVLERALDRALSLNTDRTSTESSLEYASTTRRKQRSCSLSPNILRRCKRIDSMRSQVTSEPFRDREDRVLVADTGKIDKEGVNAEHTSDVKPPLSCDSVGTRRCYYGDAPYMLHVSPEQLRKQRALLKPAVDRRLHGAVVQVLDMADVLRNAITRRRKFMDPSEEFTCGTNRSVSEWSLEGT